MATLRFRAHVAFCAQKTTLRSPQEQATYDSSRDPIHLREKCKDFQSFSSRPPKPQTDKEKRAEKLAKVRQEFKKFSSYNQ